MYFLIKVKVGLLGHASCCHISPLMRSEPDAPLVFNQNTMVSDRLLRHMSVFLKQRTKTFKRTTYYFDRCEAEK